MAAGRQQLPPRYTAHRRGRETREVREQTENKRQKQKENDGTYQGMAAQLVLPRGGSCLVTWRPSDKGYAAEEMGKEGDESGTARHGRRPEKPSHGERRNSAEACMLPKQGAWNSREAEGTALVQAWFISCIACLFPSSHWGCVQHGNKAERSSADGSVLFVRTF